jgi:hypothetical protein
MLFRFYNSEAHKGTPAWNRKRYRIPKQERLIDTTTSYNYLSANN